MLYNAGKGCNDTSRLQILRREGERLYQQAELELEGPALEDVQGRYQSFLKRFEA